MGRRVAVAAFVIVGLCLSAVGVMSQSAMLNLPDVSQAARITQRIGITDIAIDYHRPRVRGRKIFGGLVPYGKVWRAGANVNTTISISDPVAIDGQALPKGVYGVHMVPGEDSWIVIFSKNSTSWGSFTYDQAEDALRITVKPQAIENREALTYDFDDPQPDSTVVTMRWEKVAIAFKIVVNTPQIVEQSLRKQLRGRVQFEWQPWEEAATYLLDNHLDTSETAKYVDRSIEMEDRFENEMTKARVLRVLGQSADATATQNKAIAMGAQVQIHSFARSLQAQGRQNEALGIFRDNIKKDPNSWIAHNEAARLAVARGDFDTGIKEMRLAAEASTGTFKSQNADLVRLLENRVDINK